MWMTTWPETPVFSADVSAPPSSLNKKKNLSRLAHHNLIDEKAQIKAAG
jgi:hypothetical protein